jgi:hypothetical protein
MAKPQHKAFKRLDRRIKAWNDTVASRNVKNPAAFRKPGSMKRK